MLHAPLTIYDSRNYISLLAVISLTPQSKDLRQQKLYQLISLFLAFAFLYSYLRQQKLYQLISPIYSPIPPIMIYDSRNYISLLAPCKFNTLISVSTIVEIILAYQPLLFINVGVGYLRQQKLYQLISLMRLPLNNFSIYDSRNYISLLAPSVLLFAINAVSTIVEIILAYQPILCVPKGNLHLRQQKLYQLISLVLVQGHDCTSTIVEIILAYQPDGLEPPPPDLRQQKLYQLISLFTLDGDVMSLSTIVEIILAYQPP